MSRKVTSFVCPAFIHVACVLIHIIFKKFTNFVGYFDKYIYKIIQESALYPNFSLQTFCLEKYLCTIRPTTRFQAVDSHVQRK